MYAGEGGREGEGDEQVQRELDSYTVIKRDGDTVSQGTKDQFCRLDREPGDRFLGIDKELRTSSAE
jgi:hypothetical protein